MASVTSRERQAQGWGDGWNFPRVWSVQAEQAAFAGADRAGRSGWAGQSFVFGGDGIDSIGPLNLAGVLTAKAVGTIAGVLNWNDLSGTGAQSPLPFTGSYTVDSTGRVTLTGLTDGSTFNYSMHLILGGGKALLVSSDANDAFGGEAIPQTPTAALAGNFGLNAAVWTMNSLLGELQPESVVGSLAAASSGTNLNGYADMGAGTADFAVNGKLTATQSGELSGTLTGFTPAARGQASHFTLYLVDGTQSVLIETDNSQLVIGRIANGP